MGEVRTLSTVRMAAIAASASIAILATTVGGLAQNSQGQNGNGQGQNGNGQGQNGNGQGGNHAVPAPAIDTGVPAMLLVGGVLLGTILIRRLRKASDYQAMAPVENLEG
jgi:hypothetical protein